MTIVVDNGSIDNSAQRIKEKFSDITLIQTGKNLGYAGGNNVCIRYAMENKAKYVHVLEFENSNTNEIFQGYPHDVS